MNWQETRTGEVLLGRGSDLARESHIRSGFRVTTVFPEGLRVRRIHAYHLKDEVESWTLRWDQLQRKDEETGEVRDLFHLLPEGTQLPLL
jgi:hypothetical protein